MSSDNNFDEVYIYIYMIFILYKYYKVDINLIRIHYLKLISAVIKL